MGVIQILELFGGIGAPRKALINEEELKNINGLNLWNSDEWEIKEVE